MPCKSIEIGLTIVLTSMCSLIRNSTSPLLSLPQEIKDRIYGFLYSGHIFQIEQGEIYPPKDPNAKLTHYICECSKMNHNQDTKKVICDVLRSKYSLCQGSLHSEKLELALLQTCRQIHSEARHVLYFRNTFSFKDPCTLHVFGKRSSDVDKLTIRGLRLVMDLPRGQKGSMFNTKMGLLPWDEIAWSEAICLTVVDQFKRLQNVELYIVQGSCYRGITNAEFDRLSPARANEWITFILELRHLSLKSAKIVLRDWDFVCFPALFHMSTTYCLYDSMNNRSQYPRWSLALKEDWADYARKVILRQTEYPDERAVVSLTIVPIQNRK